MQLGAQVIELTVLLFFAKQNYQLLFFNLVLFGFTHINALVHRKTECKANMLSFFHAQEKFGPFFQLVHVLNSQWPLK